MPLKYACIFVLKKSRLLKVKQIVVCWLVNFSWVHRAIKNLFFLVSAIESFLLRVLMLLDAVTRGHTIS